jgi:SpoIID/LytB domain protein
MSQWGADGFASHGWSYRSILAHYYPGTRLEQGPERDVRVLVAEGRARLVVSSRAPFGVVARGRSHRLAAGRYVVPGRLRLPLRFLPGVQPLALDGNGYRGELLISGAPGSLSAVNAVPLERYLRGVVTDEMPFSWPPAALEAQAVASRSYALSQLKPAQSFDLFADGRDQMYGGIRAETRPGNLAVGATAGQVLTWEGRVALTYYDSSSGGRTAAVSDAIPGMPQFPYLVSVDDPYDGISPHHRWGPIRLSAEELARRLRLPGARTISLSLDGSGRVAWVGVSWPGGRKLFRGRAFQTALGLPSTWFEVAGGAAAGASTAGGDWPAGRPGWTVVLGSIPESAGLPAARALAARAARAGAPRTGALASSEFSNLQPGYLVVFSGVYGSASAARAAQRPLAGRFPQSYVRKIVP